jgi:hypothetical protein
MRSIPSRRPLPGARLRSGPGSVASYHVECNLKLCLSQETYYHGPWVVNCDSVAKLQEYHYYENRPKLAFTMASTLKCTTEFWDQLAHCEAFPLCLAPNIWEYVCYRYLMLNTKFLSHPFSTSRGIEVASEDVIRAWHSTQCAADTQSPPLDTP